MKKKKIAALIIVCIITMVFCTACSKKGQDKTEATPAIQADTDSGVTGEESSDKTAEPADTPEEGKEDGKETDKNTEEPDFISSIEEIGHLESRTEVIALDMDTDTHLALLVPQYHSYNSGCSILDSGNRLLIAIGSEITNKEKRVKENSVEAVMEAAKDVYRRTIKTELNGSYYYEEMVFDSQQEMTVNGVDLNHFTGYIKGQYSDGEETGMTYYVEGYTYVHTNQVPVYIIGTVLWDNEGKAADDFGGRTDYAEEIIEELSHNLHEMINTIELKDSF